jgi:hypothetical protein
VRSPNGQLAEKKLEFRQFENVRHFLSFRALAHELDWVVVNPLVPHCVMKDCAHQIPNLRSRAFRPLDAVQPFFNGDRLYLIKSVISPTRQNPDPSDSFHTRLASRTPCVPDSHLPAPSAGNEQPVRQVCPVRLPLRGLLVGVNAQRFGCFEGRCFGRQRVGRSRRWLSILFARSISGGFIPPEDPNIGPLCRFSRCTLPC